MTILARALAACALLAAPAAAQQAIPIGIIDFYGLREVSADRARAALTFKEGDTVSDADEGRPAFLAASEARLAALPGVAKARLELVCCDNGRAIVYVGIEERGSDVVTFRSAPDGNARLAPDIVAAGEEFSKALTQAVERGDAVEDRSRGHALNHDPAMRAVQDRFVLYAERDLSKLRQVLRTSSHRDERALAAQVLGYAPDKAAVVDDLAYGLSDPYQLVRNNAMRALLVIAEMAPRPGHEAPSIPAKPFIALLNSPVWSDRNKASSALEALTRHRDPALLDALKRQAIPALAEMARWKSDGHAQPGFLVLARIANYSDAAALDLWKQNQREVVIRAATR